MNMFRSLWTRQTADADAEILRSHSERRVLDTIDRARIKSKAGETSARVRQSSPQTVFRKVELIAVERPTPNMERAVVGSPVPAIRKSEAYTYDKSRLSGERAQLFHSTPAQHSSENDYATYHRHKTMVMENRKMQNDTVLRLLTAIFYLLSTSRVNANRSLEMEEIDTGSPWHPSTQYR
ncbi:hypothetical protein KCU87_g491, partial [Aureobasidium melanogenum]